MALRNTLAVFAIGIWAAAGQAATLDDLSVLRDVTSHRASSYDTTGGNTDNVTSFAPGSSHVLLDTEGPGRITHMWMTVAPFQGHTKVLRDLVLRIWWDDAKAPSVEVPLGDFFGLGHGMSYPLESIPVAVGLDHRALNCYWPMPFQQRARIEIVNNGYRSVRRIYYNIDYELGVQPEDSGLFHALWRREAERLPQTMGARDENYVVLDVEGDGQYVGTALYIDAAPGGWWGEGDEAIFIDGGDTPQLHGTGTEDYFSNAWGYKESFCYPYYGAPLVKEREDGGSWTSVYRWHVADPIRFRERVCVTLETVWEEGVRSDVSSVAYWYQKEPMSTREPLPGPDAMAPKRHGVLKLPPRMELDATVLEEQFQRQGIVTQGTTSDHGKGYRHGGWLRVTLEGEPVTVRVPVAGEGEYALSIRVVDHALESPVTFQLDGNEAVHVAAQGSAQRDVAYVDLGSARASDGALALSIAAAGQIGLDALRVAPVGEAGAVPHEEHELHEP